MIDRRDCWQSDDGAVTLYLGDCLEILPTLSGIVAVVTDPPYGIGYVPQVHKLDDGRNYSRQRIVGDEKEPDMAAIFQLPCFKIIWGAENFYRQLPHRGRWLCWHKRSYVTKPNSMPSGDFELAWMDSRSGFYKYIQVIHGGCVNDDSKIGNNQRRFHPTQKPVRLMTFCLEQCPPGTACDPFMGSGTTGVACVRTGRRFVGIEIEPKYFEIAKRRIQAELERFPLLEKPARMRQRELAEVCA